MFEVGRLCIKIAGRDAGKHCVITEVLDDTFVKVDGQTRRRKCNIKHLEPLDKVLNVKKSDTHDNILAALKKEGIKISKTKKKPKK